MVEQAGSPAYEADPNLADSRAQFVGSLGRRLEALRQALSALEQSPRSSAHRDHLRRRIHAFGAAAGVLGFERVFEAFREAETILGSAGPSNLGSAELGLIGRTVDLVPSLVLGAATPDNRAPTVERRGAGYPTSVLVFGAAPLAESLVAAATSGGASLECERTEEATRAEEIVRAMAPDVAVVDADRLGARELMETLAYDPLLDPVRIIAVGTFDRPEAAADLVALGVARVLPKPVSPDALKRSVMEVARERGAMAERVEPIGETTVEALAERLSQELRRGLVDAMKPQGRGVSVALGDGTDILAAAWSSVARIRELVTLRSGGAVRFEATGPEGAVPLAPWMGDDRSRATLAGEKRSSDGVSLTGRTIVVADDDPSVVWFLAGLFRNAGAEVLEAHDGRRALELAHTAWPDVVVSDILMPELDGFALCREIKRDVALSDVPVVLLSWKEDLLQRVRELGADADGYLRKEATASTVVQRVKEVLLPRARIEARIGAGTIARGRLDGLTPRLVLEVTCRLGQNAHLTVRDAAFLYEVDVRGGRVRTATRTASDGRAETGERALSTLLGVRAGRFAVRRDSSECPEDWNLDIKALLEGPIERARAARGLLADSRRVARVETDAAALEPYLAATPGSVRGVAERLAEGESPENIVSSGIPAGLLESVLIDIVLHGAVVRLVGRNGEDLLVKEIEAERVRRAVSAQRPKTVSYPGPVPLLSELVPSQDESAEVSPLALPGDEPQVPATDVPFDEAGMGMTTAARSAGLTPLEDVLAPAKEPFVPAITTATFEIAAGPATAKGLGDAFSGEGFETLLVDSSPPPPEPARDEDRISFVTKPKSISNPILSAPTGPSPLESAVLSIEAPTSARSRFTSSVPPPSSDRKEDESPFLLGMIEKQSPGEAQRLAALGGGAEGAAKDDASPKNDAPAVDLGDAIAAFGESESAPKTAIAGPAPPAAVPAEPAGEAPPAAAPAEVTAPDEPLAPESGQRPLTGRAPSAEVETPREGVQAEANEPNEHDRPTPKGDDPARVAAAASGEPAVTEPAAGEPKARGMAAAKGDTKSSALRTDDEAKSAKGPAFGTQKSAGAPAKADASQSGQSRKTQPRTEGGKRRSSKKAQESGPGGTLGIAAVVCIAAFSSFSIVRAIRGSAVERPTAPPAVATTVAETPPPPSAAPAHVSPPSIDAKDMDLPLGLAVDADRGLLEIEISATQNLFVDGVLIGPGPFRQLPLREGMHLLKIQGDGVDTSRSVEIRKGRRVRVGVTSGR